MFKIVIIIAATFVHPTSDKITERVFVNEGPQFTTLDECRNSLQHSSIAQGSIASAVRKLTKFVDRFEQPDGYTLRGERVRATCVPADLTTAQIKALE